MLSAYIENPYSDLPGAFWAEVARGTLHWSDLIDDPANWVEILGTWGCEVV